MSNMKSALASTIDPKIVDYVDEVERVHAREHNLDETHRASEVARLKAHIEDLRKRIAELEGLTSTAKLDDKYALTKAKLVRLLKDMGYYD